MIPDRDPLAARAAVHAALGDPARLRIVDTLLLGDSSPSELALQLGIATNLLAHHLNTLRSAGLVTAHPSEGDGRRSYLRLVPEALDTIAAPLAAPRRIVFVCTANSARSHLAAALWRQASDVPTASAGTHPAPRIADGAVQAARRHGLPLPRVRPRHVNDVVEADDLVITVCDRAHEAHGGHLHWSIPDPVARATDAAFDDALATLSTRVTTLARHLN